MDEPPKKRRGPKYRGLDVPVTLHVDAEMSRQIDAYAEHEGWSRSRACRQLMFIGLRAEGFRQVGPPPDLGGL